MAAISHPERYSQYMELEGINSPGPGYELVAVDRLPSGMLKAIWGVLKDEHNKPLNEGTTQPGGSGS